MKRDIVCIIRLMVDSLPPLLRNSRMLFEVARICFKLPPFLFYFREKYKTGLIPDLSIFYKANAFSLDRVSKSTDINSMHLNLIKNYILKINPDSLLDAGCGSGYLIKNLSLNFNRIHFIGVDYQVPKNHRDSRVDYRAGDLLNELQKINDNSIDFVLCAHVVEHLANPKEVVYHLERICSKCLVIICPIEKEFRWGMNYHVNFFPNLYAFSSFLHSALSENINKSTDGVIHERLGDAMYVNIYK